jgi:hypothetical protein
MSDLFEDINRMRLSVVAATGKWPRKIAMTRKFYHALRAQVERTTLMRPDPKTVERSMYAGLPIEIVDGDGMYFEVM